MPAFLFYDVCSVCGLLVIEAFMHYVIQPVNLSAHLYLVTCEIDNPERSGQVFSLPAWIPGSYMVREFAKNIVSMSASCGGEPVGLVKLDKGSWRADPCDGPLVVRYEVYAWDLSVRTAHLDGTHGFFNGSSVFVMAHGREDVALTLDILPPLVGGEGWRVATSMRLAGAELYGFGRYCAGSYEELIDHPVEMGLFTLATFDVSGVPHDVAITGRHRADVGRLCADLKRICEAEVAFFGGLPDIERYLFLVMVVAEGYGGLEHRASCSLLCSRKDLPSAHDNGGQSEGYRGFLGLCSHEYFHTWNVKQIKPAAFVPYDLSREAYTRQLWVFEGITSYYDDLFLLRSGLIDLEGYLQLLAQGMSRVWMGAGRLKQSVAESSFDAWIKFYRQDENSVNSIVSYYAKGAVIALALDLTIRKLTQNERSLDDVMLRLWREFGKGGVGLEEGEVERIAAEVAGSSLDDFFERYLYGTVDQPLAELLALVGVGFSLRSALSADDKGGRSAAKRRTGRVVLGAKCAADPMGVKLVNVFSGGSAEAAGLAAGDVVVSLDRLKVVNGSLEAMLEQYCEGELVTVHAFRRDELMSFELCLQPAPADRVELTLLDGVDAEVVRWRHRWAMGS